MQILAHVVTKSNIQNQNDFVTKSEFSNSITKRISDVSMWVKYKKVSGQ